MINPKRALKRWLLRRLPPCKVAVEVISQSFERKLSLRERVILKLHLWVCAWCLWYTQHLRLMRDSLRSDSAIENALADTPGLSDEARERIKQKLR
jgi:hypothetical protein